ncbi:MAG: dTDP-4-dehydrorhamnose reductase [Piscirickettsiaceae bacterium]|nr:dTDP-4-dehydrorhamnose reductase [Piscirickettsiaceae bacterium]
MKILLFGKNGQVGWELQRSLAVLGEVIALSSKSQAYCGDFTDLQGLAETIRQIKPDIIVNATAYTAVDKAESEGDLVKIINTDAVEVLAQETKALDALLIHYSTDYVFDGEGSQPWKETDKTNPINTYGKTKLAGEIAIQNSACKYLIFRTSWVYGVRGNNFAKTMLRLAKERDSLSVIDDQFGAPTGAELLADITAQALRLVSLNPELCGLYHLVASGETTWHGFARFVIGYAIKEGQEIKVTQNAIVPVETSAFPTSAKRPHNSTMDTSKLQAVFDLTLPQWQAGVERMLTEYLRKD